MGMQSVDEHLPIPRVARPAGDRMWVECADRMADANTVSSQLQLVCGWQGTFKCEYAGNAGMGASKFSLAKSRRAGCAALPSHSNMHMCRHSDCPEFLV